MSFLAKVSRLDRRWIYLVIALSVALPLVWPFSMPVKVSPHVQSVYAALDALPRGSTVLLSFEYGPSTMPEVHPMADAVLEMMIQREHKLIVMGLWAEGVFMARDMLDRVAEERHHLEYGVDYINLGYKAGNEVVIKSIAESSREDPLQGSFPVSLPAVESIAIYLLN